MRLCRIRRWHFSLCYSKYGLSLFLCPHNIYEIFCPSNVSPFFPLSLSQSETLRRMGYYCTWVERNYVNIWSHFLCCGNIALAHDGENATFFFLLVKNNNVPYQKKKKVLSTCKCACYHSEDVIELNWSLKPA